MKVQELSPILWTKNLNETILFYEDVLGFSSESNFPNFASLSKNDARIMFVVPNDDSEENSTGTNGEAFFPKPSLTGSIYFFIADVDDCWATLKDKARIKSSIADRGYLMRDFSILDNNGYELVFGQDISHRQTLVS